MPELPEVETIKNDLKEKVLGRKITAVKVGLKKIIKSDFDEFMEVLLRNSFKDIERIGKLLVIRLSKGEKFLLIHLKMTGQLIYMDKKSTVAGGHSQGKIDFALPNKYSHVVFSFAGGGRLFFNDMRQFGYLKLANLSELECIRKNYGVDAMSSDFNIEYFLSLFKGRKTSIKAFLLNQKLLAGLGNIYVDEILFQAGVLPSRQCNDLKKSERVAIFKAIKPILSKAIKYRGTTFNSYRDSAGKHGRFLSMLKVYHRNGQPCQDCGTIIQKKKVAQRGTSYCPKCQK